jgi:hypothetical protein
MNMTAKEMKAKTISIPNPWAPAGAGHAHARSPLAERPEGAPHLSELPQPHDQAHALRPEAPHQEHTGGVWLCGGRLLLVAVAIPWQRAGDRCLVRFWLVKASPLAERSLRTRAWQSKATWGANYLRWLRKQLSARGLC